MTTYPSAISRKDVEFSEDAAMQLSVGEYIILSLFVAILFATICISAWSGILLVLDHTQGGGPLGMLFTLWQNF